MEAASGMASRVNTPEESEETPLEENLSAIIGRTGFFHRALFSYEMVAMVCLTLHNIVHSASASDADHWCRLPDPPANTTLEEWRDANIPREENGTMSRCLVYSVPVGERPDENVTRVAVPCSARVFNVSANVKLSIIKQWDLTCERKWMASACETVYTIGSIIGLMLSGLSADRIGRKPTICFSAVVLEVVGISLSSVGSVFLFTCHRFLVAAATHAIVYTQYIMLVEVVATQWRAMYMTFVIYGYLIGFVIKVFTLGDDIDWRNQQLIIMLPTTALLCGFFLLPESPRWSLTNLRVEEAVRAVAYILRCNRATPDAIKAVIRKLRLEPLQTLHRRMSANEDASQYLSHRRTQARELVSPEKNVWELLVILITQYQFSSLTISFCWFACSISFYGLALDIKMGSIDSWFQFALVAVSPMATYVLVVWLGRRDVLAVSLYIVCISCIAAAFLPRGSTSVRFVSLSSAWFFSNIAYTVLFVYATEIYPTVVRALSFNFGAGLGRIGTIIAPYIYHGAGSKFDSYLLLAFTCGLSGFLVGKLPDTKEVHLPEMIKPEENLFDFSPLRQHASGSRGGMGLGLQDTSSNASLLVPALLKVSTSKPTSPIARTPDQKYSSRVVSKAAHTGSAHRQRSVKPAPKKLARARAGVVTEARPSGRELSVSERVAGGATQSASAGASAATEDGKPAEQLADDAERKRASRATFTDEGFGEDRPNAGSPKRQEVVSPSGISVDAEQSPSESSGQCRSPSTTVVGPVATARPKEGPHLGVPEPPSSTSPVAAASTAVVKEAMERWSATPHHPSPVRDSIPAEVVSPTLRRADAQRRSTPPAVATRPAGGVPRCSSPSPSPRARRHNSPPTTPNLGVGGVASSAEAPQAPERPGERDEVGARAVQATSLRAVAPEKKAGTLRSPRRSVEGAGSSASARSENIDGRRASPLRRDAKDVASPKMKRNKLFKHRQPRADRVKDHR
ncbi:solute carrier family 22 member 6-B-like isoform X2 [Dermacentor andersoni]|uniref:solute carrier family 22 member 6-B-like isoform X2 n=1 Tax=Dermacentor andersoni TaxID=34620 RepID=UPI003B3BB6D3